MIIKSSNDMLWNYWPYCQWRCSHECESGYSCTIWVI